MKMKMLTLTLIFWVYNVRVICKKMIMIICNQHYRVGQNKRGHSAEWLCFWPTLYNYAKLFPNETLISDDAVPEEKQLVRLLWKVECWRRFSRADDWSHSSCYRVRRHYRDSVPCRHVAIAESILPHSWHIPFHFHRSFPSLQASILLRLQLNTNSKNLFSSGNVNVCVYCIIIVNSSYYIIELSSFVYLAVLRSHWCHSLP